MQMISKNTIHKESILKNLAISNWTEVKAVTKVTQLTRSYDNYRNTSVRFSVLFDEKVAK